MGQHRAADGLSDQTDGSVPHAVARSVTALALNWPRHGNVQNAQNAHLAHALEHAYRRAADDHAMKAIVPRERPGIEPRRC